MENCCEHLSIKCLPNAGDHHRAECPKYKTEKFPRLFYYEEAINAWAPVPERIDQLVIVEDQLEDDEKIEIEFNRKDMTDEDFAAIPVE